MFATLSNAWGFKYSSTGSVNATLTNTSLDLGSANVKGSWFVVASAGQITTDLYDIGLVFSNVAGDGQPCLALCDLGVDPGGSTSYGILAADLIAGQANEGRYGGVHYSFPVKISSGSQIAVRGQRSQLVAWQLVGVRFDGYGKPSAPEMVRYGQKIFTINSSTTMASSTWATSIVPGATGAFGSWTLIGQVPAPLFYFQMGFQHRDGIFAQSNMYVDLSVGDDTNKKIIAKDLVIRMSVSNEMCAIDRHQIYAEVASGDLVYARATTNGGAESLMNMAVYGVAP